VEICASARSGPAGVQQVVEVDPGRPVFAGVVSTEIPSPAGRSPDCSAVEAAFENLASMRVESFARTLGSPTRSPEMVQLASTRRVIDSPPTAVPMCGPSERDFTFVQRMKFTVPRDDPDARIPILWTGPSAPTTLHVRARGPLLTVDGNAAVAAGDRGSTDACDLQARVIAAALSSATQRARRVAAALSTSLDPRPIAIVVQHGTARVRCLEALPSMVPAARHEHLVGSYEPPSAYTGDEVGIVATFQLGLPTLSGKTTMQAASDPASSFAARFGYVAPPIAYPDATVAGDATREARLRPDEVDIQFRISPDRAHGFRPIDPAAVTDFASLFGIPPTSYAATFEPGMEGRSPAGTPWPDALEIAATVPYRGAVTQAEMQTVGRSAQGYPSVRALAESKNCTDVEMRLASDVIRTAAAAAHADPRARVVAIDLRGPFVVDGTCLPVRSAPPVEGVAGVTIPDVRLAAYARVSFAAR